MIVPRTRLLVWFAAVVLPCALFAGIAPSTAPASISVIVLFALVVAVDAFSAPHSVAGIRIEVAAIVRMSRERQAKLEARIHTEDSRSRAIRVALRLPPEISTTNEELLAIVPATPQHKTLHWLCTPARRGKYALSQAFVEGTSFLGFWAVHKTIPLKTEIRVYPDLLTERRSLAAIFLKRGTLGLHLQRQVGKGRDFEKLREYSAGDGYDEIYWKATARRGKPITKVFQIERTQEIYVVVDASRLSARATSPGNPTPALDRMVTASLILGLAAEQQGDLFGLVAFADGIETFIRARTGKSHYAACRDALYTVQPRVVTPDFDELCTFIRLRMRRRALIIFLTSLDDPALAESFVRNIELIRRQHLVMVHMLRQPGIAPMFSSSGSVEAVDDLYRVLGSHLRWEKLRQIEKTLKRRGVHFSLSADERFSAELVSQYLRIKQRQLL